VLLGFQREKDFKVAKELHLAMQFMAMGRRALAFKNAMNYRTLR
jgi:hypothetical protein